MSSNDKRIDRLLGSGYSKKELMNFTTPDKSVVPHKRLFKLYTSQTEDNTPEAYHVVSKHLGNDITPNP